MPDRRGGGGGSSGGEAQCAAHLAAILTPALPHLLSAMRRAAREAPPAELLETQHGVLALKRALHLLTKAVPPTPIGAELHEALGKHPIVTVAGPAAELGGAHPAASAGKPLAAGPELICQLLVGLSSWIPSWLLADVVSAFWAMRMANPHSFAAWLHAALAIEGVPRPGLSVEHKGEHEHQLTVKATAKSAFKASLKHLCGGKKKQSAGMPPAPTKAAGGGRTSL